MKAVVITKPGGVEVLEIREVETPPDPAADRVRVRVHASALNRADVIQRRGYYPAPPGAPGDIPGLEFAGEIDRIGPEVRDYQPGDRVFGICGGGAHAEYVTVPASHLARIPSNLDWADAAAVPEVFITAHASPAFRTVLEGELPLALKRAIKFAFGREAVFVRDGGTIGAMTSIEKVLKCPILFLGLSLPEHGKLWCATGRVCRQQA